jgi:hypothetical protein
MARHDKSGRLTSGIGMPKSVLRVRARRRIDEKRYFGGGQRYSCQLVRCGCLAEVKLTMGDKEVMTFLFMCVRISAGRRVE